MYEGEHKIRESRVLKKEEIEKVKYIEHLGNEPYNKIFFFDDKPRIVPYSLAYWHSFVGEDFVRLNKKYLVRKGLIETINKNNSVLSCGTEIRVTERQFKKFHKR